MEDNQLAGVISYLKDRLPTIKMFGTISGVTLEELNIKYLEELQALKEKEE